MPPVFRVGVDIGGTFTDIVLLGDDGARYTKKVSSSIDDYARAIVEGLSALLAEVGAEAVCLIHSYVNPLHEQLVKKVATQVAPSLTLSISSEVLPEIKEYERTSTTVINAYVRPIVEKYLSTLTAELARIGVYAPLLLMQSNGGLTTAKAAAVTPMHIIESGPAAGVVGVQALARQVGIKKAISFDMGGTTAKASIIENGCLTRALEYSVGGGVMIGSRLLSGAGYTLKCRRSIWPRSGRGAARSSGSMPAARCRSGRRAP